MEQFGPLSHHDTAQESLGEIQGVLRNLQKLWDPGKKEVALGIKTRPEIKRITESLKNPETTPEQSIEQTLVTLEKQIQRLKAQKRSIDTQRKEATTSIGWLGDFAMSATGGESGKVIFERQITDQVQRPAQEWLTRLNTLNILSTNIVLDPSLQQRIQIAGDELNDLAGSQLGWVNPISIASADTATAQDRMRSALYGIKWVGEWARDLVIGMKDLVVLLGEGFGALMALADPQTRQIAQQDLAQLLTTVWSARDMILSESGRAQIAECCRELITEISQLPSAEQSTMIAKIITMIGGGIISGQILRMGGRAFAKGIIATSRGASSGMRNVSAGLARSAKVISGDGGRIGGIVSNALGGGWAVKNGLNLNIPNPHQGVSEGVIPPLSAANNPILPGTESMPVPAYAANDTLFSQVVGGSPATWTSNSPSMIATNPGSVSYHTMWGGTAINDTGSTIPVQDRSIQEQIPRPDTSPESIMRSEIAPHITWFRNMLETTSIGEEITVNAGSHSYTLKRVEDGYLLIATTNPNPTLQRLQASELSVQVSVTDNSGRLKFGMFGTSEPITDIVPRSQISSPVTNMRDSNISVEESSAMNALIKKFDIQVGTRLEIPDTESDNWNTISTVTITAIAPDGTLRWTMVNSYGRVFENITIDEIDLSQYGVKKIGQSETPNQGAMEKTLPRSSGIEPGDLVRVRWLSEPVKVLQIDESGNYVLSDGSARHPSLVTLDSKWDGPRPWRELSLREKASLLRPGDLINGTDSRSGEAFYGGKVFWFEWGGATPSGVIVDLPGWNRVFTMIDQVEPIIEKLANKPVSKDVITKAEKNSEVSRTVVEKNARIKDPFERIETANRILSEKDLAPLTPEQAQAVLKVHYEISQGVYRNGIRDLRRMTREMDKANIHRDQQRILIEHGICGKMEVPPRSFELTHSESPWDSIRGMTEQELGATFGDTGGVDFLLNQLNLNAIEDASSITRWIVARIRQMEQWEVRKNITQWALKWAVESGTLQPWDLSILAKWWIKWKEVIIDTLITKTFTGSSGVSFANIFSEAPMLITTNPMFDGTETALQNLAKRANAQQKSEIKDGLEMLSNQVQSRKEKIDAMTTLDSAISQRGWAQTEWNTRDITQRNKLASELSKMPNTARWEYAPSLAQIRQFFG